LSQNFPQNFHVLQLKNAESANRSAYISIFNDFSYKNLLRYGLRLNKAISVKAVKRKLLNRGRVSVKRKINLTLSLRNKCLKMRKIKLITPNRLFSFILTRAVWGRWGRWGRWGYWGRLGAVRGRQSRRGHTGPLGP
jgi:hypothetical protein